MTEGPLQDPHLDAEWTKRPADLVWHLLHDHHLDLSREDLRRPHFLLDLHQRQHQSDPTEEPT